MVLGGGGGYHTGGRTIRSSVRVGGLVTARRMRRKIRRFEEEIRALFKKSKRGKIWDDPLSDEGTPETHILLRATHSVHAGHLRRSALPRHSARAWQPVGRVSWVALKMGCS